MIARIWRGPEVKEADFVVARTLATAARIPDRPALIDAASGTAVTFGTLSDQLRRTASSLARLGVGNGDVVATLTPNSLAWVPFALAVMGIGGIVTGINPALKPDEIVRQLKASGATTLAVAGALFPFVASAGLDKLVKRVIVLDGERVEGILMLADLIRDGDPSPKLRTPAPDDVVLLPFSSGTSGFPKGVEVTARSLAIAADLASTLLEPTDADVAMATTPFFHIAAVSGALCPSLAYGTPLVIIPSPGMETLFAAIARYRVSFAVITPPLARAFAQHPAVERHDLSSLRRVICTAAALDGATQIAASERIGTRIFQCYAMTESVGPVVIGPVDDPRPGSSGKAAPGVEIRIVDPSGRDSDPGASGEVWFRSPMAMRGYFNDPGATAEAITADGWVRTGDIGRFDEDGNLFIVDRLKELIKVNGAQVAPAELEALIAAYPGVADVAVIGRPSVSTGERPVACVVASAPIKAEALLAWVAERVAPFKRPDAVEFVDAIPRQPTGKIMRRILRDRVAVPAAH